MEFAARKTVHIFTAGVSYTLFLVRGIWMLLQSPLLQQRWVRIVPHVNDTILLAAGIWLTTIIHQYPGANSWLTAKLTGLILYIFPGLATLRPGRTKRVRAAAWVAVQFVFGYIVAVAINHYPVPFRSACRK